MTYLYRRIFYLIYRLVALTWRIETQEIPKQVHILGTWHEDLPVLLITLSKGSYCAQVSLSKDGELLNYFFKKLRFHVYRGSSSKGASSIRSCLQSVLSGQSLTMALDGPRGPRRVAKPGTYWVASKSQRDLYIAHVQYGRHKRLNTWDQMAWPLPFSKIQIQFELQEVGDNI